MELQEFAASFVESTRSYIFIRPEDRLLILRPNQVHYLNDSAVEMLSALYKQSPVDVSSLVAEFARIYQQPEYQIAQDLQTLLQSLSLLLQGKTGLAPAVRSMPFGSHQRKYPVLSEIALTYRCNNRCFFCYASAPQRGHREAEMSTDQVKLIIDKIIDQAKVPTVSFTGGEPTLRKDLPELIDYAYQKGLRTNLITNGIHCAEEAFVKRLAKAGLDSAQVSLEAGNADIHDAVVEHPGAFEKTVQGVKNLKSAGIHTHTNTTINTRNRQALIELIDFLASLGQEYLSMNMVIRTGGAVGSQDLSYTQIGELVLALKKHTEELGMRFVWYSPVPYCLFNPAAHGLGSQSCAAADGLLSIAPDGQVLPCSSFEQGIGNLLKEDFNTIWNRPPARYWREKRFLPPGCRGCDLAELCCGACPLYWDEQGSFDEISAHTRSISPWEHWLWQGKRRWQGQVHGVGVQAGGSKPT